MEQRTKNVSPFSNKSRNAYVIEHLTDTMLALIKEKELADISISELCDGAGVGRTSFYRNYTEKEDILRTYINTSYSQWAQAHSIADGDASPLNGAELIFAYLDENKDFYRLLYRRGLLYLFKDAMLATIGPRPKLPNIFAYWLAFAINGIYGWIEEWFARGMQESAEEMAAATRKIKNIDPNQIG